jgi:hypothetical protein
MIIARLSLPLDTRLLRQLGRAALRLRAIIGADQEQKWNVFTKTYYKLPLIIDPRASAGWKLFFPHNHHVGVLVPAAKHFSDFSLSAYKKFFLFLSSLHIDECVGLPRRREEEEGRKTKSSVFSQFSRFYKVKKKVVEITKIVEGIFLSFSSLRTITYEISTIVYEHFFRILFFV